MLGYVRSWVSKGADLIRSIKKYQVRTVPLALDDTVSEESWEPKQSIKRKSVDNDDITTSSKRPRPNFASEEGDPPAEDSEPRRSVSVNIIRFPDLDEDDDEDVAMTNLDVESPEYVLGAAVDTEGGDEAPRTPPRTPQQQGASSSSSSSKSPATPNTPYRPGVPLSVLQTPTAQDDVVNTNLEPTNQLSEAAASTPPSPFVPVASPSKVLPASPIRTPQKRVSPPSSPSTSDESTRTPQASSSSSTGSPRAQVQYAFGRQATLSFAVQERQVRDHITHIGAINLRLDDLRQEVHEALSDFPSEVIITLVNGHPVHWVTEKFAAHSSPNSNFALFGNSTTISITENEPYARSYLHWLWSTRQVAIALLPNVEVHMFVVAAPEPDSNECPVLISFCTPELPKEVCLNMRDSMLKNQKLALALDIDDTLLRCVGIGGSQVPADKVGLHDESRVFELPNMKERVILATYTREFLMKARTKFNLCLCTLGNAEYANDVALVLDPQKEFFSFWDNFQPSRYSLRHEWNFEPASVKTTKGSRFLQHNKQAPKQFDRVFPECNLRGKPVLDNSCAVAVDDHPEFWDLASRNNVIGVSVTVDDHGVWDNDLEKAWNKLELIHDSFFENLLRGKKPHVGALLGELLLNGMM